ncbi:MAG TPA: glucoamylase family protein, partial [Thermoanaerobaculaceae bacterium]|nr:glucoamylase family protein [Thermoanaerobaculaceae bacterium]
QFSHVWIDFRGIQDGYMRARGIDYFENTRRAVYAQRAYAIANPAGWAGYGENVWGVTACDGPADVTLTYRESPRRFYTYAGRGAGATFILDDGTVAPTAAASSLPFAPEIAVPAVRTMYERYGNDLWSTYGFFDAFNPTFTFDVTPAMGRIVPGAGWFGTDYLGLDQGPIVAMIENYRDGFVWDLMRKNPYVVSGLRRAGFAGGWLDRAP